MANKAKVAIAAANLAIQHPWGAWETGGQLHPTGLHTQELRRKCPDGAGEPPGDVATQRGGLGPDGIHVHPGHHGVVVEDQGGDVGRVGVGGHNARGEGDGLPLGDVAGERLPRHGAAHRLGRLNAPQGGVRERLGVACGRNGEPLPAMHPHVTNGHADGTMGPGH